MADVDSLILFCETVCHVCCRSYEKNSIKFIFSQDSIQERISEKICKYTPFPLNNWSHPAAVICTACADNLNSWDTYIQSCIEARNTIARTESCNANSWEAEVNEESSSNVEELIGETLSCDFLETVPLTNFNAVEEASEPDTCGKSKTKVGGKSRNTYCIAKWCNNNSGEKHLSFFRLPKDQKRAEKWLVNAKRYDLLKEDINILHTKYLCERHFSDVMFMNEKRNRLVWDATPSIFPDRNSSFCSQFHEGENK